MRISDWSSDVCSSDLFDQPGRRRRADEGEGDRPERERPQEQGHPGVDPRIREKGGPGDQSRCGHRQWRERRCARPGRRGSPLTEMTCRHEPQGIRTWPTTMSRRPSMCPSRPKKHRCSRNALDRKSVVSGTSVSVRVDIGGRRIIKKKKKKKKK